MFCRQIKSYAKRSLRNLRKIARWDFPAGNSLQVVIGACLKKQKDQTLFGAALICGGDAELRTVFCHGSSGNIESGGTECKPQRFV